MKHRLRILSCSLLLMMMSRAKAKESQTTSSGVVDARLVNGDGRCSGRLEIKHQMQWRTLQLEFSGSRMHQAAFGDVACKQMGCGVVKSVKLHINATEPKPAWKVHFPCRGGEQTIRECEEAAPDSRVHSVESAVSGITVECSESLRVEGRAFIDSCSGIIMVKSDLNWVYVCKPKSDRNEQLMLNLMCAELSCGTDESAHYLAHDTAVDSRIIQCQGNETRIEDCPSSAQSNCTDVLQLRCYDQRSVRIVGQSRCRGVVEGKRGSEWRPLLSSWYSFEEPQLRDICRDAGCGSMISVRQLHLGVSVPLWVVHIECESNIYCRRWNGKNGQSVVELACTDSVRLSQGSDKCSGFVEVKHEGVWRYLRHDNFTLRDMFVGCRDLNCGFPLLPTSTNRKVRDAMSLNCSGHEEHLVDCPVSSLPAEGAHDENKAAFLTCGNSPIAPEVNLYARFATVQPKPKSLTSYEGHNIFITCSIDSPVPVKSFHLMFRSKGKNELKGNQSAVDNAVQFVIEAELNQKGHYFCHYDYEFRPDVFSERTEFYINVKEASYVRLSGGESRCMGRLELEHEGEWRAVVQQLWGLNEATVVCKQLHCGSAVSTDSQSRDMQPVWRFYSDCDGSESALLGCGSVRTGQSASTVSVICSDVLHQPNISLIASDQLKREDHVVVYSPHSFYIHCSVQPQFPGGYFSLVFTGVTQSLSLNATAAEHSAVFTFKSSERSHSGNYSCVYHNTVSGLSFSSRSQTLVIVVKEYETRECVFYDRRPGPEPGFSSVQCGLGLACFGLWEEGPGGEMLLLKQGCWEPQSNCRSDQCLVSDGPVQIRKGNSYRFCCCGSDLCNSHYSEVPPATPPPDSHQFLLDDGARPNSGTKVCSGRLMLRLRTSQMKMVTAESSGWDMRHASIVCRQLHCGNKAVSTSKTRLPHATSMWRFYSDCDGSEAALMDCGHVQDWISPNAVHVVCEG